MTTSTTQQPEYLNCSFELIENIIIVKAKLNGYERNFLFDSGAGDLILNKKYINPKNLIKSNKKFKGVNGEGSLTNALLKNFNWNNLIVRNKIVDVINLKHLEVAFNQQIHGIIGYKIFRDYALHIDYKAKNISLWMSLEKSPFKVMSSFAFLKQKHIPVFKVAIGNKHFNMGLDTGAAANLLHTKHLKKINKHLKFLDESTLSGGTGEVQNIKLYELDQLTVNKASYKKMKFIFSNIDHINKSINEIDGLLGYQFLKHRQTVINFPMCEIQFVRKKQSST